jgi:hypothetical protein
MIADDKAQTFGSDEGEEGSKANGARSRGDHLHHLCGGGGGGGEISVLRCRFACRVL